MTNTIIRDIYLNEFDLHPHDFDYESDDIVESNKLTLVYQIEDNTKVETMTLELENYRDKEVTLTVKANGGYIKFDIGVVGLESKLKLIFAHLHLIEIATTKGSGTELVIFNFIKTCKDDFRVLDEGLIRI